MAISQEVSQRISALRYPLILFVILTHCERIFRAMILVHGSGVDFTIKLSCSFTSIAVHSFFAISGYLFANKLDDYASVPGYFRLLKNKFFRLIIPYVFFNISLILFTTYVFYISGIRTLMPFSMSNFIDQMWGRPGVPINYPLWFLRDLIVLFLLSPVFIIMLREIPLTGFLLIVYCNFFNGLNIPFFHSSYALFFYLGGLLAVKKVRIESIDTYLKFLVIPVSVITLWLIYANMNKLTIPYFGQVTCIYRLMGLAFLWYLAGFRSVQQNRLLLKLGNFSFFIYLCHEPTLSLIQRKFCSFYLPSGSIPQILFYFGSAAVVTGITFTLGSLLSRYLPRFYCIITGEKAQSARPVKCLPYCEVAGRHSDAVSPSKPA